MNSKFKTIGIIGRVKTSGVKDTLNALVETLCKLKQNIIIEAETAESLTSNSLEIVTREELGSRCNLLIVVGGDGSLLHAAHEVVDHNIPVLGINRGSLGFLTDISPNKLNKIKDILDGKYVIEKRFLITTKVELHGKILDQDYALNEIAILPDATPHMIEFEIYIDDVFVCSQDSDGLIIATPTGSTAYALSGGGPILHPQLDAMVLVPMFPHTLSSRPIVIEGNRTIKIVISPHNTTSPRISCDGRTYINAPQSSHILIQKKSRQLHLIHPLDYNYYEALRSKLHWGKKLPYTD
jgi:NAD+ kinase